MSKDLAIQPWDVIHVQEDFDRDNPVFERDVAAIFLNELDIGIPCNAADDMLAASILLSLSYALGYAADGGD